MIVRYKPSFIRQFDKLDPALQEEVLEKIELFKSPHNHRTLRVHPLRGHLKGFYSFSVNFRFRIVCEFEKGKKAASLVAVGDHSVYH